MARSAPLDFADATLVVIGRLGALTLADAALALAERGARLRRGLSRATRVVVVGHRAHTLLDGGRLERRLGAAARSRARIVSENVLLRGLGLLGPIAAGERSADAADIARASGLTADTIRWLTLFDVIEPDAEGKFAFRDLVAAKGIAGKLTSGVPLPTLLADAVPKHGGERAKRGAPDPAQLALALPNPGNPAADDLFEAAHIAEEDGDLGEAEVLYRRCLEIDRRDPTAMFNLANVLAALGRQPEARLGYERALVLDPAFVEARYNLAHLQEAVGNEAAAKANLQAAVKRDATYADAWFNLASLLTREGDLDAAIPAWERYLALDATGEWSERAKQSLALCRMQRQARSA